MITLGPRQIGCLRTMLDISRGTWSLDAGWMWTTQSGTDRIMQSLKRRGFVSAAPVVTKIYGVVTEYRITSAGRRAAKESK